MIWAIGATGKTGRALVHKLVSKVLAVRAMMRGRAKGPSACPC